MWKEKLYTGTLTTYTGTTTITRLPDSGTVTVNIYKTDKLNECIVDFLKNQCGVTDVVYYKIDGSSDSRKGNLFIYGTPFQFYVVGTYAYFAATSGSSYTIISGSASTTCIFNGSTGEYSIRICMAGNPKGSFGFAIGATSYGGTAYGMGYLMVYRLQDVVNSAYYTFIQLASATTSNLWLTKSSDNSRPYNSAITTGLADASNRDIVAAIMNLFPNKYPLIPKYYGPFKFIDVYALVSYYALGISSMSTPAQSYFVKIGSDTYFVPNYSNGLLIKCEG